MARLIKLIAVVAFVVLLVAVFGQRLSSFSSTAQAGGLAAPTGLIASDGSYSTKIGLTWDAVRSATLYRISRNTVNDPATATVVGTTIQGTFFDATATPNQTFFYWVQAENGPVSSPFSQPDQGLRAIGQIVGPVQPLNPPNAPPANQITAAKATLGKILFWEEQLSSTRTVSCGSCHFATSGGSDSRSIINSPRARNQGADGLFNTADDVFGSPGVPVNNGDGTYVWSSLYGYREQVTGRKSRSYIDAAYSPLLFWDGRAVGTFTDPISGNVVLQAGAALESQVTGPPVSSVEMAHGGRNWNDVAARLVASKPLALSPSIGPALTDWIGGRPYPELFQEVFGTPDVTPARIALAIGTFERTVYSDRTPFDLAVSQVTPLIPAENRGQAVFNGQGRCNTCHLGNLFTDNAFHNTGVRPQTEDTGRFQVTGNINDLGAFRTTGLRNVELRGPFFHNGRFGTLEEVIDFYNRGGDFDAPNIDRNRIRPLGLSPQQRSDLAAYLRRPLTDPRVAAGTAQFSRPVLYSESNRVPQIVGTGTTGSGNLIPEVTAIEPPLAGNPSFTVAVANALGGAQAVLVINGSDPGTGPGIPATGSLARVAIQLSGSGAGAGRGSVSVAIPGNAAVIGATFFGRWFVVDPAAPGGVAVTPAFRMTVFGEATTSVRAKNADFDGDGKTDISVFRPSDSKWYILQSSDSSLNSLAFGISSDTLAPADFDGDGKTDIAVFRSGTWYIQRSQAGFLSVQFGAPGDRPQPADYDGDGIGDIAVWRPSDGTWYIQRSHDGFVAVPFGINGDRPVVADYDGDGKADPAVYRDGIWYLLRSTAGFIGIQFGTIEDRPVAGDYDGDGKADIAVWRPSNGVWYYVRSSDAAFRATPFGVSNDTPTPGDYDGDGINDLAVFRPTEGNWYVLQSTNNQLRSQLWGLNQDVPVPSAFVP